MNIQRKMSKGNASNVNSVFFRMLEMGVGFPPPFHFYFLHFQICYNEHVLLSPHPSFTEVQLEYVLLILFSMSRALS